MPDRCAGRSTRLTQDDEVLLRNVEARKVLIAVNKDDLPQVLSPEDLSRFSDSKDNRPGVSEVG